jgi:hypothetical protein
MTYDSLVQEMQNYSERTDATFVTTEIPQIILKAENQIASEARGLGFINSITADLVVGEQFLAKPARWRETVSFQIGTGSGFNTRVFLLNRTFEFIRSYWTNPSLNQQPKYYADWTYAQWLLGPTPDNTYPYEILYHERPQPLEAGNQSNWTTEYAPDLMLYAALWHTQLFLKRDDRVDRFDKAYTRALKAVEHEQKRRQTDKAMIPANA